MQNVLIPAESLIDFDDEPRLLDTELASHLEFKRSYDIRELINRNREELGMYGPLPVRRGQSRGQAFTAYYLNEGQALVICALSRTPKAAQVRKLLIDVFMAYRQGKLVHVKEHRRSLPQRRRNQIQFSFEENLETVYASTQSTEELMAGLMTRLQNLEIAAFGEPQNARQIVPTGRIRGY